MKGKVLVLGWVAFCAVLGFATTPNMLYKLNAEGPMSNGANIQNKGTGAVVPINGAAGYLNYVTGGNQKFGDYAYSVSSGFPRIVDTTNGLGCSTDTGFTISFFINNGSTTNWADAFGFRVGEVSYRLERTSSEMYQIYKTGTDFSSSTAFAKTSGWQHLAIVYHAEPQGLDVYSNGAFVASFTGEASVSGVLKEILVGRGRRNTVEGDFGSVPSPLHFDDIAVFDASLTADQVAWLAANEAAIPPTGAPTLALDGTASSLVAASFTPAATAENDAVITLSADTSATLGEAFSVANLLVSGTGTLSLAAGGGGEKLTVSGTTTLMTSATVGAGAAALGSTAIASGKTLTLADGAVSALSGAGSLALSEGASVALSGASYTGSLALGIGTTYTETIPAGTTHTITGLSGSGAGKTHSNIIKEGAGTLVLTGPMPTFDAATSLRSTELTVNGGTLQLGASGGNVGGSWGRGCFVDVTVGAGATLALAGQNTAMGGTMQVNGTLTSASYNLLPTVELTNGTLSSGTTATSAGSWCGIHLPSLLTSTGASSLTGPMNLSETTTFTVADALSVGGALINCIKESGAVPSSLSKTGAGTMMVGANPTYTGTTTVSAGRYELNATHTSGGVYSVAAGATLAGTGRTTSAVTCAGTVEGGLTVGALTMENGSSIVIPTGKPLTVTGELAVAADATVTLDLSSVAFVEAGTAVLLCGTYPELSALAVTGVPSGYIPYFGPDGLTYATAEHLPKGKAVRVHPFLTRGVGEEAVIGIEGLPSGTVDTVTFRLALVNGTVDDLNGLTLWRAPGTHSASVTITSDGTGNGSTSSATINYRTRTLLKSHATSVGVYSVPGGTGSNATFSRISDTECTVTYANPAQAVNASAQDTLWLAMSVSTDIPTDATITVTVDSAAIGGLAVTVDDASAPRAHAVFPYRHHIGAYYKDNTSPAEATVRFPTLTEVYAIEGIDAAAGADGYELTFSAAATTLIGRLKAARDANHPGMQVLAVIKKTGGVTAAMLPENREAFAANATRQLKELGLDGLDVDYEYCYTAAEYQNHAATLGDLAIAFFPNGLSLSAALSGNYLVPPPGALQSPDWLNVMAYDGTSLNASYAFMKDHYDGLIGKGVPARRMVMGQAIYGNDTQTWSQPGWGTIVSQPGYTGDDCDTCVYANNNTRQTFTGPTTYRGKVRQCIDWDLGGIFSWGYYSDVSWEHTQSLGRHQAQIIWPRTAYTWAEPAKEGDVYILSSEEDWFWFAANAATVTQAKLGADITFMHDPKPVATFTGAFDGQGHTLTFPAQTWLVSYDDVALFVNLSGSVKNLNVDFAGRVISRRDRKIDAGTGRGNAVTLTTRGGAGAFAALLVAKLNGGGTVENVRLTVREGAEIRGQHEVGALIAQLYTGSTAVVVRNCTVDLAGTLTTYASDSLDAEVTMTSSANADIGALIGQLNWSDVGTSAVTIVSNAVILRPSAVIEAKSGTLCSAAGAIGNLNPALNGQISGLAVTWYGGASVTSSKESASGFRAQPWIGNRNGETKANAPVLATYGSITSYGAFRWAIGNLWIRETAAPEALTPVAFTVSTAEGGAEPLPAAMVADLVTKMPDPDPGTKTIRFDSPTEAQAAYVFDGIGLTKQGGLSSDGTQTLTADYAFGVSALTVRNLSDTLYVVLEATVKGASGAAADYSGDTAVSVLRDGTAAADATEVTDFSGATLGTSATPGVRCFRLPMPSGSGTTPYTVKATRP